MDIQVSQDRPRLKNFRTEAILRSAENGSVNHIAMLNVLERYPDDVHDGTIVLRTALRFLDAEPFPQKPNFPDSPAGYAALARLKLIFGWMGVVSTSIRRIGHKSGAVISSFAKIYEDNFHVILRWLNFWMREASWAFTIVNKNGDLEAPRLTIEVIHNMHHVCSDTPLRTYMDNSEEVTDLLLTIWMWQDKDGNAAYLSYPPHQSEGRVVICPIIKLFMMLCLNSDSQFLFWERIARFSKPQFKRFMDCTMSRVLQWNPPPREQLLTETLPMNGLETLTIAVFSLIDIPGIARSIAKSNIISKVFELARAQGDIPTMGPVNASFALKEGYSIFYTHAPSGMANLQQFIIPQLLQAGFLEVVIDDMVKRHARNRKKDPFYSTGSGNDRDPNPFAYLAPLCIHRRICDATLAAIDALPESMAEILTHGWAAKYWTPFIHTVGLYDRIWSKVLATNRVTLCDNLKHVHHPDRLNVTEAKECSFCQSVVYCSVECQKEDWELHRPECPLLRVNHFDMELRSAIVSHRTRMFHLRLMQQLILNVELGLPYYADAGTLSEDGHTLKHPHISSGDDREAHICAARREDPVAAEARNAPLVQFNLDLTVPRLGATVCNEKTRARLAADLEELKDLATTHIPRYNTIYREVLEEALKAYEGAEGSTESAAAGAEDQGQFGGRKVLALCSSSLGQFDVVVFGRFKVKDDEEGVAVSLLNGWVRITPKKDMVDIL